MNSTMTAQHLRELAELIEAGEERKELAYRLQRATQDAEQFRRLFSALLARTADQEARFTSEELANAPSLTFSALSATGAGNYKALPGRPMEQYVP